jgi:hypothetical protein
VVGHRVQSDVLEVSIDDAVHKYRKSLCQHCFPLYGDVDWSRLERPR